MPVPPQPIRNSSSNNSGEKPISREEFQNFRSDIRFQLAEIKSAIKKLEGDYEKSITDIKEAVAENKTIIARLEEVNKRKISDNSTLRIGVFIAIITSAITAIVEIVKRALETKFP